MHVITQRRIWDAKVKYPYCAVALDTWYRIVRSNIFSNYSCLKAVFSTVDKVGDLFVFNIGGHKLRLIANISFASQKLFIRHILTHAEYDRDLWREN